ncbi:MAG: TRAP transporter small permease [Syntrophaceae bacterium]|nr:TRAP transporter small permease [Syntrophaceae bacterium]
MGTQIDQGHPARPEGRIEWVCRQTGWIAGSLAVIMMFSLIREVVGRYFFNRPTDWAVDLNSYLLVIMVYLGAAYTTSIDGHVRADFLYGRIKGKAKAVLDIFIDIASIFYVSILLWEGGLMAWESFVFNEVSTGGVRWPLAPFQAMVPLGSALVIFLLFVRIARNVRLLAFGGGEAPVAGEG